MLNLLTKKEMLSVKQNVELNQRMEQVEIELNRSKKREREAMKSSLDMESSLMETREELQNAKSKLV